MSTRPLKLDAIAFDPGASPACGAAKEAARSLGLAADEDRWGAGDSLSPGLPPADPGCDAGVRLSLALPPARGAAGEGAALSSVSSALPCDTLSPVLTAI